MQAAVPGRIHQSLLWLFRRDPKLAVEVACRVAGRPLPRDIAVRDRNGVLQRPGFHHDDATVELDLVLSVHDLNTDRSIGSLIRHIWIVEVQLGRDPTRAQAWADYLVAAAREFDVAGVDVEMLVVCPDPVIRRWLVDTILSRMSLKPLMLEARHVPWIEDLRVARSRPEAAVLSAVFHGQELRARKVVHAACRAIASLEPKSRARYRYLIQTAAHEAMALPQPIQAPTSNETPTEWEQRGLTWAQHGERFAAQGREEGREEGRKEGELHTRRACLFTMFELVGLIPSIEQRALVERCDDPVTLESWTRRLKGASSISEVLHPNK